jgi:hypothetical protein
MRLLVTVESSVLVVIDGSEGREEVKVLHELLKNVTVALILRNELFHLIEFRLHLLQLLSRPLSGL